MAPCQSYFVFLVAALVELDRAHSTSLLSQSRHIARNTTRGGIALPSLNGNFAKGAVQCNQGQPDSRCRKWRGYFLDLLGLWGLRQRCDREYVTSSGEDGRNIEMEVAVDVGIGYRHHPHGVPGMGTAMVIFRRFRVLFGWAVDLMTLKRVRQMRGAAQEVWHHRGPVPVRYRKLLQELREQVAAIPRLEQRARRVRHDLDNITLCRYLEAANWVLELDGKKVAQYIEDTVRWREQLGAHRLRAADAYSSTGIIFVKGHDLERRPIVYFRPTVGSTLGKSHTHNIEQIIFHLERAIRLMPRGSWQYTVVVDCEGLGLHKLPPIKYIKLIFTLLTQHYPMRLGAVLFANAGHGMMLCWKFLSPLVSLRTKKKMRFIPTKNIQFMTDYIHPNQLLACAGGLNIWQFVPEEYYHSDASSM